MSEYIRKKLGKKYYRKPWNEENTVWLTTWWPHFGTGYCAKHLGFGWQQVKGKINKLCLVMLPKIDRLCIVCKENHQEKRRYGFRCKPCYLKLRQDYRSSRPPPVYKGKIWNALPWFRAVTRTARHRSKNKEPSDITAEFLNELWNKQDGKCFYSGMDMILPKYGAGRPPDLASLDRRDSRRGYTQNNVVWCAWACNAAKSDMTENQYVQLCRKVITHMDAKAAV